MGGVCLSACWDTPLWSRCLPGAGTPLGQTPPLGADPLAVDTLPRADTPLGGDTPPGADTHPLEQTPPGSRHPLGADPPAEHAGRYGQRAGSTHPTGMQSSWKMLPLQKCVWCTPPTSQMNLCAVMEPRQKVEVTVPTWEKRGAKIKKQIFRFPQYCR